MGVGVGKSYEVFCRKTESDRMYSLREKSLLMSFPFISCLLLSFLGRVFSTFLELPWFITPPRTQTRILALPATHVEKPVWQEWPGSRFATRHVSCGNSGFAPAPCDPVTRRGRKVSGRCRRPPEATLPRCFPHVFRQDGPRKGEKWTQLAVIRYHWGVYPKPAFATPASLLAAL